MPPLLELDRVTSGYGRLDVLHELSMTVPQGSTIAIVGSNGVGKTTTLSAICGLLPIREGEIRFDGERIDNHSPYDIARRGLTLLPEGRGVFPHLTVDENLTVASHAARDDDEARRHARLDEVVELFPRLAERRRQRAGTLSGGEQQMLALARAFLAEPRLLLMDEISMGLAPLIVADLFDRIAELRRRGTTIVMVEQFLTYALRHADLCYVMAKGQVVFVGDPGEIRSGSVPGYFAA
jgi:branched-chain amino acid transport system ATP-binding protein